MNDENKKDKIQSEEIEKEIVKSKDAKQDVVTEEIPVEASEEAVDKDNKGKKKKKRKKNKFKVLVIVLICLAVFAGLLYQGYRMVRDMVLENMIYYLLESESKNDDANGEGGQNKIDIQEAAAAFERLNGVEPEKKDNPKDKESKPNNKQIAKDIVSQISEADKNRAIAIVSSVASVDDCFALYELAMNGDQDAKNKLKDIYSRFSQAQIDELWGLYEKNKHLIE